MIKQFTTLSTSLLIALFASIASAEEDILNQIYDQILVENSVQAVNACNEMSQALAQSSLGDSAPLLAPFENLVAAWKTVEVSYILGSVDVDAIDYPIFIDMYHMGNEDINRALSRALASDSKPATALYKNSYKTINALEAFLFNSEWNARAQALAIHATDNLCQRLDKVAQSYQDHRQDALDDHDQSIAYLLNGLVSSTYKTSEWRVGDAAGLSRKYKNDPDARRVEYPFSGSSLFAIGVILDAHKQMIGAEQQPNFATYAHEQGADEAMALAQQALDDAFAAYQAIPADTDFSTEDMQALFDTLNKLQLAYYHNLLKSLDVVAKILEADGD